MLTGHIQVGEGGLVVLGVTPEDLRELGSGRACTIDGARLGLPEHKFLVMPAAHAAEFEAEVTGMARQVAEAVGVPVVVVPQQPEEEEAEPAKVPS